MSSVSVLFPESGSLVLEDTVDVAVMGLRPPFALITMVNCLLSPEAMEPRSQLMPAFLPLTTMQVAPVAERNLFPLTFFLLVVNTVTPVAVPGPLLVTLTL